MASLIYISIQSNFLPVAFKSKDNESRRQFNSSVFDANGGGFAAIKQVPSPVIEFDLTYKNGKMKKKTAPVADFYDRIDSYVFNKKAISCLPVSDLYIKPIINNYPLQKEYEEKEGLNQEFFLILSKLFIKDIIDMDKSMIQFWDDGRPERVLKLVLKEGIITPPVFKLAEFPKGETYFSQEFVDAYQQNNLTGVTFRDARQLRYKGSTVEKTNIPYAGDELCEKNSLFRRPHANTIGTVVGLKLFTCLNLSNSDVRNTNKRVEF